MATGTRQTRHLEHRQLRGQQLLEAVLAVISREGPTVSMERLASELGVTKPVLYRYFGDRAGLYRAVAQATLAGLMRDLRAALAQPVEPRQLLTEVIDAYLSFIEREPQLYRFLMQRAVVEQAEAQVTISYFIRDVGQAVAQTMGQQLRPAGADSAAAEAWAYGVVGMVQLAGDWWLERRPMPRPRLVAYLADLLWNGFSNRA
ncbi:MAG TPA: TetR/AcrR family transcriptional regulator [Candidatus Dormibacteraeota bacterium]|jgi:AcrR family transcriptional regulator